MPLKMDEGYSTMNYARKKANAIITMDISTSIAKHANAHSAWKTSISCLLYTSDAADESRYV